MEQYHRTKFLIVEGGRKVFYQVPQVTVGAPMKIPEKPKALLEKLQAKLPRSGKEPSFVGKRIKRPIFSFRGGLLALGTGFLLV